jgi:hypothetical protein
MPKSRKLSSIEGSSQLHPVVQSAKKEAIDRGTRNYGFLYLGYRGGFRMRVGPESLQRALQLFDRLFKLAEQRGYVVDVDTSEHGGAYITINGVNVGVELKEKVRRETHTPTASEIADHKRHPSIYKIPDYDFFPSGNFEIILTEYYCPKRNWAEGERWRLEERLDRVLESAEEGARRRREEDLKYEAEQKAAEDRRRQAASVEDRRRAEEKRIEALFNQAKAWRKAQDLRDFADAVAKAYFAATQTDKPDLVLSDWLHSIMAEADRHDPQKEVLEALMAARTHAR